MERWGWRRWLALMVFCVSGLAVSAPAASAGARSEETPSPVPASDGGAPRTGSPAPFLGVVIPHDSVDLSSKFEGRMEQVLVDVGDRVRKGEVLARLDVRPLEQDLAVAKATLQASRAEEQAAGLALAEAREKKGRYFTPRSLELGVYSQEELATIRYQESTALARLEAARARSQEQQAHVVELEQNVGEAELLAPFDGVVATRPVSPGTRVSAGQPILRVLSTGGRKVRFAVPEDQARQLEPGSPLRLFIDQPAQTLAGHVESIAPEVDAAARLVFAVATFDSPPPDTVATGMVAHVRPGPAQGSVVQLESSGPTPTRSGP
ncbi:efflux RND transporter periplasmic adaptor subunit [Hyalangium versicolor]|uniref:efflux RND transporter periplasmic adaptor subunit n=1 Tax=Hyalangium versicolor TaxID=2861190 RepID=UPI001CC95339|nr:efflux RND transporter periplasmic adaptor subunit [Hyalangium versicolor]